jgi:hypothetical protein
MYGKLGFKIFIVFITLWIFKHKDYKLEILKIKNRE